MSHLAIETVEHVRILRLDRPERKNALTSALGWSIVRALGDAQADDDVRVVALTGNGDAFCSGLDLGRGDDEPADTGLSEQQQVLDEKGWVGRFLLALRFDTDKPVVAGINGVAVGRGALAGDGGRHPDRGRHRAPAPGVPAGGHVARRRPHLVAADARRPRDGDAVPARVALRARPTRRSASASCRRSCPTDQLDAAAAGVLRRPSPPRRRSPSGARSAWSRGRRWSPTSTARVREEIRSRARRPRQRGRAGGGAGDHGEAHPRVPRALR